MGVRRSVWAKPAGHVDCMKTSPWVKPMHGAPACYACIRPGYVLGVRLVEWAYAPQLISHAGPTIGAATHFGVRPTQVRDRLCAYGEYGLDHRLNTCMADLVHAGKSWPCVEEFSCLLFSCGVYGRFDMFMIASRHTSRHGGQVSCTCTTCVPHEYPYLDNI